MSATKQDYVAVARAIREVYARAESFPSDSAREHWQSGCRVSAECIADEFARLNPRFDRAAFIVACGVKAL